MRSGRGEVMRAEFLGLDGTRVHVRFLKEIQGRNPESWIHAKRLIGGLPEASEGEEDRGR